MNIEKLASTLSQSEAYLIISDENCFYLTDFYSSEGYLFITQKERIYLTDSRYIEAAGNSVKGCTDIIEIQRIAEELEPLCASNGISTLYVESERMTLGMFTRLQEALPFADVIGGDVLENEIYKLRNVKSAEEVDKILKAQAIAEKCFDHILPFIKPGVREIDIALEMNFFMLKNGAMDISFDTIAVAGAKTSMPHGVPGENRIKDGDFFLMDYGALYEGYHSDMTRTVGVGNVSEKQVEIYNTVLAAQKKSLGYLAPGASCSEADLKARNYINSKGYGEYFGHSTGHGVGVEIHELPRIAQRNTEGVLETGNVVTVEPGIYIPGEFGVRIEDMALITEDGSRNLTSCPKDLIILPL